MTFLGVDLGWQGRPSGVSRLQPYEAMRLDHHDDVLDWIRRRSAEGGAVVAVDAPLVIPNASGMRPVEKEMHREFGRFHAGCYPAHLGMPFAAGVTRFSHTLGEMGFDHLGRDFRGQLEVHPHAATVQLFGLDRIIKYKRGPVSERRAGLQRLRELVATLIPGDLPHVPEGGKALKEAEDMIDASLCAYLAWNWWRYGESRNRVFGNTTEGYIVVPNRAS